MARESSACVSLTCIFMFEIGHDNFLNIFFFLTLDHSCEDISMNMISA